MEYGGYIEFEYYRGREYHEAAVALNSGRHCLEFLIRKKNIKKLYIPYFTCHSVVGMCEKTGVQYEFYHIDSSFMPKFEKKLSEGEWLYLVNFYGQISNKVISELKGRHVSIILDNTQDFFRYPVDGVDTLYTCRKFFGVADGGYLYTDADDDLDLPTDTSACRMEFLMGRLEKGANEYYRQYVANNKIFSGQDLKRMSLLTGNIMRSLDYEHIKNVRTENFTYLHERFKGKNPIELTVADGAYVYPLYAENGPEIRAALTEKKIYIPCFWKYVFDICEKGDTEYLFAENILPLPVDHRYTVEDMKYIAEQTEHLL